jgi:hypothetical protein
VVAVLVQSAHVSCFAAAAAAVAAAGTTMVCCGPGTPTSVSSDGVLPCFTRYQSYRGAHASPGVRASRARSWSKLLWSPHTLVCLAEPPS